MTSTLLCNATQVLVLVLFILTNLAVDTVSSFLLVPLTPPFFGTTTLKTSSSSVIVVQRQRRPEDHGGHYHIPRQHCNKHSCSFSFLPPKVRMETRRSQSQSSADTASSCRGNDKGRDPLEIVTQFISQKENNPNIRPSSLRRTILHVPPSVVSENVTYTQKATSTQIRGNQSLLEWDCGKDMIEELLADQQQDGCEVSFMVRNTNKNNNNNRTLVNDAAAVQLDPTTILVKWNVTWIPPTAGWLQTLGNTMGWTIVKRPYNDLSSTVSVFRWNSVFTLFAKAWKDGILNVPLACIEGRSILRFAKKNQESHGGGGDEQPYTSSCTPLWELTSITEELSYAEDLKRNILQNRRCAQDLRLFLELGRKPPGSSTSWEEWETQIQTCLPWTSVPGSNALDIEPMAPEEGNLPAFVFAGIVTASLFTFANILAPELIGQSVFGPPNYIVDPSELNSFY